MLSVDGVHGLGVEDLSAEELGCDFFVALAATSGCSALGGTGLVWGKWNAWSAVTPIILTFDGRDSGEGLDAPGYAHWWTNYSAVCDQMPIAAAMTLRVFHSFEHRWALDKAFQFHQDIGKSSVAKRIHGLNRR